MKCLRSLALSSVLVLAACGPGDSSNPTSPSSNPDVVVPFQAFDITIGCCSPVDTGQTVTVDYIGWLYDANAVENKGRLIDSSFPTITPGGQPFQFVLGSGQAIVGFDGTVIGMQIGGQRRVTMPPELGYGPVAFGEIPANSPLVFEIELLSAP